MPSKSGGKIRVRQIKSSIGFSKDQHATLRGLGLRKPGSVAEVEDTPSIRGMINKVTHLVAIEEAS